MTEFYQGDSSDIFSVEVFSEGVQVTGAGLDDYAGTFSLVKRLGLAPVLTKAMTVVDDTFRASILPDESEALDVGNYIAVTEITRDDDTYRKEAHTKVAVRKQGVAAD